MKKEFLLSIGEDGSGLGWTKIVKLDGGFDKFVELMELSKVEKNHLFDEMCFGGSVFYVEDDNEDYVNCLDFNNWDEKKGWYKPTDEEKNVSVEEAVEYCKEIIEEDLQMWLEDQEEVED